MTPLSAIDHLAFITPDLTRTIRFYRDLLGMRLFAGIGHDGYRHYFFRFGDNQVAFFEYAGASVMEPKFHGKPTTEPRGFDHVAFRVSSCAELFAFKDRLEAADVEVTGPVDHGTIWSIYFFDPNNIPLEVAWECLEVLSPPAIEEEEPMGIAAEGAEPQSGHWPEVTRPTPQSEWRARPGNGFAMRASFLESGKARMTPELERLLAESRRT